jgi:cytochrome b pre-mRNA-processing protein 3
MFARLSSLFAPRADPRAAVRPLYGAIVAAARAPHWYREGGVPDTIDGRFEMIAALLSLTIERLDSFADRKREMALLAELFVEDMDGQLRQSGIGDVVVGKHIGRMMGALGGRFSAYRTAFEADGDLAATMIRNIYRGEAPPPAALAHSSAALTGFRTRIAQRGADALLAGELEGPEPA